MSSRGRAVGFAAGALVCAGLAAAAAGGYTATATDELGGLRPVLVSSASLAGGTVVDRKVVRALEVRRVPASFAPPDALLDPSEALGRRLATSLPPGSYVTASDFRSAPVRTGRSRREPPGTTPVELSVSGAGAMAASRTRPGAPVDVVVTGEPGPGGGVGRTYVAAEGVPLLSLRRGAPEPGLGPGERWTATLALRRDQALRLIRAQSFAREIRLLGR